MNDETRPLVTAQQQRPYFRHDTAQVDGERPENGHVDPLIGAGTRIWHHTHVMRGARIGPSCNLGQNVFVGATAILGEGCRIQNNVNIYDGVELEDHVFCGPSMTFTNLSSPLPRAAIFRHGSYQRTLVKRHASIGAGAVIVCGHQLGESCFVAAGSTVVRDVPDFALVAGTPARRIGWVCQCGARLKLDDSGTARCAATYPGPAGETRCGRRYRLDEPERLVMLPDDGPAE